MRNPFHGTDDRGDQELIEQALEGSKSALEALVQRHQHYIYNLALKMVLSPFDAEDITQEVLIKVITKLGQFQGRSNFRTWVYRITFNHFLKMKKYWLEEHITTFEAYGEDLDRMVDEELNREEQIEHAEVIQEAKLACLSGMLLCLSREQRLVYLLGEVFGADHNIGSELLSISKANFRKRLERARKDLYQFMNRKCGLVRSENPCRCARKTKAFIQEGWVDPKRMKFNTDYVRKIQEALPLKTGEFAGLVNRDYQELFRNTPFQEKAHAERLFKNLVADPKLKETFNL